jgi:hypothetical protein
MGAMCCYLAAADDSSVTTPGGCIITSGYLADVKIKHMVASRCTGTLTNDFWVHSASDIVVCNGDLWVASMKPDNKAWRAIPYARAGC